MKKKILAGLLSLAMVFSMMPATLVSAEETDNTTQTETQIENENEQKQEQEPETEAVPEETQEQTSDSEAIEALQSRIDALPTVDEFIALADGTTVEESTLNQAQLTVYNEVQAIAEEMDNLTDEEQGQLDTGKLETLFKYFNGMAETVEESSSNYKYESIQISDASLNGNTVNGEGESGQKLDTDGGFYASGYMEEDGYLPNDGKVTTSDGVPYQLSWTGDEPYVGNDCIRIVGDKDTSNNDAPVKASPSTMTLLTYGAYSKVYVLGTAAAFQNSTDSLDFTVTLTYTDGEKSNTTYTLYDWYGNPSQTEGYVQYRRDDGYRGTHGNPILQSKAIECDDTKLLQSITFAINTKSSVVNDKNKIYAGIYAVTGAVSADAPESPTAVSATEVGEDSFTAKWNEVSGANDYVIDVSEYKDFRDANGNPSFVGKYNNYSVSGGSTTSLEINGLDKKKTYYYRVRSKNDAGQSLNSNVMSVTTMEHIHSWQYEANRNVIKAYCNGSVGTCVHQGEDKAVYLTLKLTGLDENNSTAYSGNAFNGASVENNITSITGATAGDITYKGRGATIYEESTAAPVNAGTYTAEVTIGEVTAATDFTITKADISPTVSLDDWVYGKEVSTPDLTGNDGNGKVTYYYKKQGAEDSTYTEVTDFTAIPIGAYTLKASIAESMNYNANEATCDFTVKKKDAPELKDGDGNELQDHSVYCKEVIIAAVQKNLNQVTVDGSVITDSDHHVIAGDDKEHMIVATDQSGKTTTCRVTVYKEHQYGEYQVVDKKDGVITEQKTCKNCGHTLERISKESSSGKTDVTKEEDPSGGSLASDVKVQPGTPETTVSGMDIDVAKKLLTDEENKKVSEGENLLVYLEVNKLEDDAVPVDDKSKTEEKVKEIKDVKEGTYLDLSMYKKIGEDEATKLSKVETEKSLQISVEIPDELKAPAGKVRTYYVVRVHDGVTTILDTKMTGNEIQFETNQFSTYSLWYTEANKPSGGGSGSSGSTTPAKTTYSITTSSSEGGSITASHKGDITKGDTVTYTITPADGYEIKDVLVDGKSVGAVTSYTFTNVAEKHTISAVFVKKNAQKPDDNKNNVIDQSKLNGNQVSKLKLPILLAKGKGGKKQTTLSWLKVKDADGYEAYWSYCDGGKNYKKFATVKNGKLTVTQKKLKNSEKYKYFVVAYKMVDGKKVYIAKSNYLHVAMLDNRQTNAKSVSVNKTDVVLNKNKTFTIKAQTKLENSKKTQLQHAAEYRYYTSNARVAKVNSDGVITAKGAGSCTVYVLANNGVYKKIKVTVK